MATRRNGGTAAGLLRTALLAAILAVLTGFLGMHVLAGSHTAHTSPQHAFGQARAAGPGHTASAASTAGHPVPDSAGVSDAGLAALHESPAAPSCLCGGDCSGRSVAHVSCTPTPPGASPGAPAPASAPPAAERTTPPSDLAPATAHSPATPTPGDLSISRT